MLECMHYSSNYLGKLCSLQPLFLYRHVENQKYADGISVLRIEALHRLHARC